MSIYWLLLGITALFAYFFGSMDTMVLASNFVFHRNLKRLGDHSRWLSNFRRLFGISGFFKLLAVELVKDLIPILIGSLLLGIRGHADAGRAFAGFVLVLGRLWPAMYRFRGSHASVAMIVAASTAASSAGIAAAVVTAGVIALTRYLSLGTLAGMVVYVMVAVLAVWLAGQLLDGYFITPKIQGGRTGLGYAGVIFSFFLWSTLLGPLLGMLLAIPLSAFCVVLWRALKSKYIRPVV